MRHLIVSMGILLACLATAAGARGQTVRTQFAAPNLQPEPLHVPRATPLDARDEPATDMAAFNHSLLQLKAEREALNAEHAAAAKQPPINLDQGSESQKLRQRVGELMNQLGMPAVPNKSAGPTAPAPTPAPGPGPQLLPPPPLLEKSTGKAPEKSTAKTPADAQADANQPLDVLGLAQVLFRAGNIEQALKTFRLVNLAGMSAEEKMPVQYLIATCLRKLGKTEEAAALYREVANGRGDDQVAACAQWQLNVIRWKAEFASQLKDLHDRSKALETGP